MGIKLSWNQPICDPCWQRREGERVPVRMRVADLKKCAFCGVLYPAKEVA